MTGQVSMKTGLAQNVPVFLPPPWYDLHQHAST